MRTSSSPLIPLSTHVDEEELTFVLPKCSPIGDVFDVLDKKENKWSCNMCLTIYQRILNLVLLPNTMTS